MKNFNAITDTTINWGSWLKYFEGNAGKPCIAMLGRQRHLAHARQIARSLAIFQLGESTGGSIAETIDHVQFVGIDENYKKAIKYFVAEEARHSRLLLGVIKSLGGKPIKKNWTENLFICSRRLMGVRLKIMVMLAAEIIGLCFYNLLARKLSTSSIAWILQNICEDEYQHLDFHCDFFKSQIRTPWQRWLFRCSWFVVTHLAAAVVILDHFRTLRALGVSGMQIWREFRRWIVQVDTKVASASSRPALKFGKQPELIPI